MEEGRGGGVVCFLCHVGHRVKDCPQKKALDDMKFIEETEEPRMGTIRLFNTLTESDDGEPKTIH